MIEIRQSEMPAETDIVVPDGAELAHGFRNDSPMPTPSSCRNSENPAAAIPPAAIAPHETADESASSGTATTLSVTRVAIVGLSLNPAPARRGNNVARSRFLRPIRIKELFRPSSFGSAGKWR